MDYVYDVPMLGIESMSVGFWYKLLLTCMCLPCSWSDDQKMDPMSVLVQAKIDSEIKLDNVLVESPECFLLV